MSSEIISVVKTGDVPSLVKVVPKSIGNAQIGQNLPETKHLTSIVVVDKHLYTITGSNESRGPDFYRMDLSSSHEGWEPLCRPSTQRSEFGITLLDGGIYVVGGGSTNDPALRTTECYYPQERAWKTKAMMIKGVKSCSVVPWKGCLFRLGGSDKLSDSVSDVEMYDSEQGSVGSWRQMRSMSSERSAHAAVCVKDDIYVMGGLTNQSPLTLSSVEKYDIIQGRWTWIARMTEGRASFSACLWDESIVIVGGLNFSLKRDGDRCLTFDDIKQRWVFDDDCVEEELITSKAMRKVEKYDFFEERWIHMEATEIRSYGENFAVSVCYPNCNS